RSKRDWSSDVCSSDLKNQEGNPIREDKWRGKYWYRALRACGMRARKFYTTRHTFISDALSHGLNIKWVAEYCGTSVAMIEKHYEIGKASCREGSKNCG